MYPEKGTADCLQKVDMNHDAHSLVDKQNDPKDTWIRHTHTCTYTFSKAKKWTLTFYDHTNYIIPIP